MVSNFDLIVEKSLAFVKSLDGVYNHSKGTWNNLDHIRLLAECPELVQAFGEYGMTCTYAAAVVVNAPYRPPCHVDNPAFSLARINFPLLNCKNTITEFYTNAKTSPNSSRHLEVINMRDCVLVDKFELTTATVIRVQEAHRIVVPFNNPSPRISLTLDFDKDPVYMLESI